jgi:thiamine biosynthesis lipoprotein
MSARHCGGIGRMRFCSVAVLFAMLAGCEDKSAIERVEWTVMGTGAAVQFRGEVDKAAVAEVQRVFKDLEKLLNAHDPASEICALAKEPDSRVLELCDARMRPCYEAAFAFRDRTAGAFNPRWRGAGTLDLGAIAKGFAVDMAAERIQPMTAGREALIDLGGNLKSVSGDWRAAIAGSDKVVTLKPGESCATSAAYFRGGHIKDGRTGETAVKKAFSVTVVHPDSAMTADALSTVMYILGEKEGLDFIRKNHPSVRVVFCTAKGFTAR